MIVLPIQLHIIYKGKKHYKWLIELDEYNLLQLKNEVVKITSQDGLTTSESVQLLVTSPRNNVEVIVDTDAMLRIMFMVHDSLQVPVFKVTVLLTLRPDLELGGVIQSLLHALGVQLSVEQVAWTDADEDESPSKSEGRDEPQIVRNENVQRNVDNNDDDDWLLDFNKKFTVDGSRINHQNIAEDAEVMDDGGSSFDDESIDADPQLLANTSNSDFDLGTTQLKDYIEVHMYKPMHDGKHRLRLGDVFDDVDHFRKVLGEVMVDKSFEITKTDRKVAMDPYVKISVLHEFMQETFGVKIGNLKLYRARERARTNIHGDHAKGYEDLF
ncbi:hypothetical protein WN943_025904 [Citrus x changshan-huyou]